MQTDSISNTMQELPRHFPTGGSRRQAHKKAASSGERPQSASARRWIEKDVEAIRVYNSFRAADRKQFLDAFKLEKGCADCGYKQHSCALQFDHLPGYTKKANASKLWAHSLSALLKEIAKCEVVCANCHAVRTQARGRVAAVRERRSSALTNPQSLPANGAPDRKDEPPSKYAPKLTADGVAAMLRRYRSGEATVDALASDFGVIRQTVTDILRGWRWRTVEPEIRLEVKEKFMAEDFAQHRRQKLTEIDVRQMRAAWDAGGATLKMLAGRYGVTPENVRSVVFRLTWRHVA